MHDFRRTFLEHQVASFTSLARTEDNGTAQIVEDAGSLQQTFVTQSLAYWQAQLDHDLNRATGDLTTFPEVPHAEWRVHRNAWE